MELRQETELQQKISQDTIQAVSILQMGNQELEEYLAFCEGREDAPSPAEWKRAYFEKYDDIKDKSLKRQDW